MREIPRLHRLVHRKYMPVLPQAIAGIVEPDNEVGRALRQQPRPRPRTAEVPDVPDDTQADPEAEIRCRVEAIITRAQDILAGKLDASLGLHSIIRLAQIARGWDDYRREVG